MENGHRLRKVLGCHDETHGAIARDGRTLGKQTEKKQPTLPPLLTFFFARNHTSLFLDPQDLALSKWWYFLKVPFRRLCCDVNLCLENCYLDS